MTNLHCRPTTMAHRNSHHHHRSSHYQHHTPPHLPSGNKRRLSAIFIWMSCSLVPTIHGCALGINQEGQLDCSRRLDADTPWTSGCITVAVAGKRGCVSRNTFLLALPSPLRLRTVPLQKGGTRGKHLVLRRMGYHICTLSQFATFFCSQAVRDS